MPGWPSHPHHLPQDPQQSGGAGLHLPAGGYQPRRGRLGGRNEQLYLAHQQPKVNGAFDKYGGFLLGKHWPMFALLALQEFKHTHFSNKRARRARICNLPTPTDHLLLQESDRVNAREPQTFGECVPRKFGQGQEWIHVGRVQEDCPLQKCESSFIHTFLKTWK